MNPKKKLKFKSRTKSFCAEPIPGNLGIRFMEVGATKKPCIAMIVDNGTEFLLTSKNDDGMLIRKFMPTTQLLLKDGTKAPLEDDDQIEIVTPFGKKIVVRPLCKNKPGTGVVLAYLEGEDPTLWCIALAVAPIENMAISLAK